MEVDFLMNIIQRDNLNDSIKLLSESINQKIVFSTSFGMEDQVLLHAIASQNIKNIEIFTLDTGRLFPETYDLWDKSLQQYSISIKSYNPNAIQIEEYVRDNGINPFYASVNLRKQCCHIRKVEPLNRALAGAKIWITGLRSEQSDNRNGLNLIEWDDHFQVYKYNPLLHWTTSEVKDYILKNGVPYNPLHDKNFVSIGCAPCTRAIKEGENFRDGRWWWENESKKECGLHTNSK
jgi:phosphoadenosine phosphosulfate reductase